MKIDYPEVVALISVYLSIKFCLLFLSLLFFPWLVAYFHKKMNIRPWSRYEIKKDSL